MDNQKSNDGNARDAGREGAGSSMGKDMNQDIDNRGFGGTGNSGATSGSSVIDKAKDMAKDLSRDLPTSSDMHKSIDKAAEAAQPVVDRLASSAHAGVDKVSGALAGATRSMDEKSRQLTDAAQKFADTGREYVRSSPATSVLVALGAGYILSKILGRRH